MMDKNIREIYLRMLKDKASVEYFIEYKQYYTIQFKLKVSLPPEMFDINNFTYEGFYVTKLITILK